MRKYGFTLVILIAMVSAGPAHCFETLDQKVIHKEYEDGNFDTVILRISEFQNRNHSYSRSDSIFIARHLAVVYAANPKTVEIGKHWMYQMLRLMPASDFAGMYVNEEIDRIFDKVRHEFMASQNTFGVDTTKIVLPARTGAPGNGSAETPPAKPAPRDARQASATSLDVKRLELEALEKADQFSKEHPGEPNPYSQYVKDLYRQQDTAPRIRRRSWFGRNWWWVIGVPVAVLVILVISAEDQSTSSSSTTF